MPNMLFFVLLLTHAALPLANSCADCIKPTHSWDTLPVSLHTSEIVTNVKGEFTLKELDTIARYCSIGTASYIVPPPARTRFLGANLVTTSPSHTRSSCFTSHPRLTPHTQHHPLGVTAPGPALAGLFCKRSN